MLDSPGQRIESLDWQAIENELDQRGFSLTEPVLNKSECGALIRLYGQESAFRSRVVMARHNFGRGEYKYFADPLPAPVSQLRTRLFPHLARIANLWCTRLRLQWAFPVTLSKFLETCREKNQNLPTPLMLRYESGDYNCLHQDLYGEVAFPLQAACVLSQRGADYEGGEFLLTEQRPRMQTRAHAITVDRGQLIIFPNRWRPIKGSRGDYRATIRHGVSTVTSGMRYCLGLIFHDSH
jgi:hypothetical protein